MINSCIERTLVRHQPQRILKVTGIYNVLIMSNNLIWSRLV